ncbi:MAG: Gfo/Idh/MocA family oxidoreductase [Kofleriaceae bacterium]
MRLAFLGCGKIARAHAKRLKKHARHVTLGFASRDGARANEYAAQLGGEAYASYEAAIASPDVDAVAVVTPPSSHLELTLAGLRAGKHVVLEKPPLLEAKHFDDVEAAARASGKRVFVAENYQYKPLLRRMRDLLARDMVGDVLFIHINAIKKQTTEGWRADPAVVGGGALFEGGIHWVDFMANLGLPVRGVRGMRPALAAGSTLERSMLVEFQYDRAVGTLAYSWEVPSTAKGLRLSKIYGREGTITFETNGLWVLLHGRKTRFYIPGLRDLSGYHAMWADFVNAWVTDSEPLMTLAKARRDLELVEQAYATVPEET